jgi:hypothetical protein
MLLQAGRSSFAFVSSLRPRTPPHFAIPNELNMCHLLVTTLACGHRTRGPLIRCDTAMATEPRGPPHDDGRIVMCSRSEELRIFQDTCCQDCVLLMLQDALRDLCEPCKRVGSLRVGQDALEMMIRVTLGQPGQRSRSERAPRRSDQARQRDREQDQGEQSGPRSTNETCSQPPHISVTSPARPDEDNQYATDPRTPTHWPNLQASRPLDPPRRRDEPRSNARE